MLDWLSSKARPATTAFVASLVAVPRGVWRRLMVFSGGGVPGSQLATACPVASAVSISDSVRIQHDACGCSQGDSRLLVGYGGTTQHCQVSDERIFEETRWNEMAVCVAGMHRSGTSMVARLLHLTPLSRPEQDMLPVKPTRFEGHWEHGQIVETSTSRSAEAPVAAGTDPPDLSSIRDSSAWHASNEGTN